MNTLLNSINICPNCGSRELNWSADVNNYGGVQDGRICMREVGPIFVLGCEECSETITVISGEIVAETLTRELKSKI